MIQTIIKWVKFIAIVSLCCVSQVWAQPTAAQQHMQQQQQNQNMGGMLQSDSVRKCGNPNGCGNSSSSMAEVRAWHERERKIQAEIAELRRTPFYMAIVWNFDNNGVAWPGGFRSERRAVEVAKKQCTSPINCRLVATFNNTCAVLVAANSNPRNLQDIFVGLDRDDTKAAAKAMQSCQAVYGVRQDRCFYSSIRTGKGADGTAFCTGYDYSLYNQK